MKSCRLALAALIFALSSITTSAFAASYSADQSDLWWADPPDSENGWGLHIVQRGSVIFLTLFVYGPSGVPTWYSATLTPNPPNSLVWSGDMYETTGSWFGAVPYNAALLTYRKVGIATWTPSSISAGTLSYTVDGVAVAKSVTRQGLVVENYSGHFGAGMHETDTGCLDQSRNGTTETLGILDVSSAIDNVIITSTSNGMICSYEGPLLQFGQMGDAVGHFSCSDGSSGYFHITELQVTEFSLTGRFTKSYSAPEACQGSGWFAGMKVTTY